MAVIKTPASGEIDAIDINRALDRADTTTMSMNGSAERALAEVLSGQISFSDFYDKPTDTVAASLSDRSVSATAIDPADANCYYRIDDNGLVYGGSTVSNVLETWRDEGSNPDFEVYFDFISGTFPPNTNITWDTWLSTAIDRTVILARTSIGTNSCVVDVSIRNSSTLAVLTTARINMSAVVIDSL